MPSRDKHKINTALNPRDHLHQSIVVALLDELQRNPANSHTNIVRTVEEELRTFKGLTVDPRAIASRLNMLQDKNSPIRVRLAYNPKRIGLAECILSGDQHVIDSIPRDVLVREYWVKAEALTYDGKRLKIIAIPYDYRVDECTGNYFAADVTPGINAEYVINSVSGNFPKMPDPLQTLYEAHYYDNLTLEPGSIPSSIKELKPYKSMDIIDLIAIGIGELNSVYVPLAIKYAIKNIKGKEIRRDDSRHIYVHTEHISSLVNGGRVVFVGKPENNIVIVARIPQGITSESFRIMKNYLYSNRILYNQENNEIIASISIPVTPVVKDSLEYAMMYADMIIKEFASLAGIDVREIEYYVVKESRRYGIPYMNYDPSSNRWVTEWDKIETVRERHRKYKITPKDVFEYVS